MNRQRRVLTGSILALLLAIPVLAPAATPTEAKAYGKPLGGAETTKIAAILAEPARYEGKVVRVEGTVRDVCRMAGCWMTLASDQAHQELRIKVEDGQIVFPVEAKGKRAIAEGTLTKIPMTLEETIAFRKHEAEEQNKPFDPAEVKEPMTYYQIAATGAVILAQGAK